MRDGGVGRMRPLHQKTLTQKKMLKSVDYIIRFNGYQPSAVSHQLRSCGSCFIGYDHKESLETDSQLLKADSRPLSKKEKIILWL